MALAMISFQAALHFPISIPNRTVTGRTCSLLKKVKGNKKLFQLHMDTMMAVIMTPGQATEKITRWKARNPEAPSTSAASISSLVMFIK